jgi:hypothetical protein
MTLPQKSEIKEDVLPLQRALRALDDAKRSLKQFRQTGSPTTSLYLAFSLSA